MSGSSHPCSALIATAHKSHPIAYHRFIEASPSSSASPAAASSPHARVAPSRLDATITARDVQHKLIKWFDGVKDDRAMPWRKEVDLAALSKAELNQRGYEVWVSEIMLQQTQVATVKAYWKRWMETFPTVQDLAQASDEQVHAVWKGLGYYSRATRLLKGAQTVVNDFGGRIPRTAPELQKVDGIGPYSAGAISSIAFGKRSAMVDGNVQRVISRLCAIHANPTAKATTNLIWSIADSLVPPLDLEPAEPDEQKHLNPPGAFNQALMELGATICTPTNPSCSKCPLNRECLALAEVRHTLSKNSKTDAPSDELCTVCEPRPSKAGEVTIFPLKKEKKKARQEDTLTTIVEVKAGPDASDKHVLVVKRPAKGLLAGFYEFPSVDLETVDDVEQDETADTMTDKRKASIVRKHLRSLMPDFKSFEADWKPVSSILHLYSHQHRTYHVSVCAIASSPGLPRLSSSEDDRAKWVRADSIDEINLGGAMVRAWEVRNGRKDPVGGGKGGASKGKGKAEVATTGSGKASVKPKRKEEPSITSFFKRPNEAKEDKEYGTPVKKKKRVIVVSDDEDE